MTYVLLMLQVVFSLAQPEFLRYLVELWKYDLQLQTTQQFEYYDFKASERSTTFRAAYRKAHQEKQKDEAPNLAAGGSPETLENNDDEEEAEEEAAQNRAMGVGKIDASVIEGQFTIEQIEDYQYETLEEFLEYVKATYDLDRMKKRQDLLLM